MHHREPPRLVIAYPWTTTAVHRREIIVKFKGPIVTLVAGAALAAGLVGADLAVRDDTTTVTAAEVTTTSTSGPAATSTTGAATTGAATTGAEASRAAAAPPPGTSSATGVTASRSAGTVTYAGKVDGGGSLSVVVKANSVVAYLCDGKNESWLWGVVDGTRVLLANPAGDSLTGTRGGGVVAGSVDVAGVRRTFTLPRVAKPSGLYRATAQVRGATIAGGWIVLPDGTQVGLLRRDGRPAPAPALDPATGEVTVDGTRITATEPDPAEAPTR